MQVWGSLAYESISGTYVIRFLRLFCCKQYSYLSCPIPHFLVKLREVQGHGEIWPLRDLNVDFLILKSVLLPQHPSCVPFLSLRFCIWRPILEPELTSQQFWLKDPLIYLRYSTLITLNHDARNITEVEEELLPLVAHSTFSVCARDDRGNSHFTFFLFCFDKVRSSWHQTFWDLSGSLFLVDHIIRILLL